jgi:hypothetical protein
MNQRKTTMMDSPINLNPNYFRSPDPYALADKYMHDIWSSVHEKHFSFLCTLTGRHRVGKSLAAVVMASLLDPTFMKNFEKRVVYLPEEFIETVHDLDQQGIQGGAIIWDEANLGISAREWYSLANKNINYGIQAFGYLCPMVFFVTQDISFLDKQPQKLFHKFYELVRTNNDYTTIYPYDVKIHRRLGKIYYSNPRMLYARGSGYNCNRLILRPIKLMRPSKEIINKYDAFSVPKKRKLLEMNRDILRSLSMSKEKHDDHLSEDEIIERCMAEAETSNTLFVNGRGQFRVDMIKAEFKLPYRYANKIKIICDAKWKQRNLEKVSDQNG